MIKRRLIFWEIGSFIWIALAGSALHFAFELSEFWQPLALFSSVNESTWEHLKMYFWPGLIYALVQYTYTKDIANNYWVANLCIYIIVKMHSAAQNTPNFTALPQVSFEISYDMFCYIVIGVNQQR